jgi:hypothetical protein
MSTALPDEESARRKALDMTKLNIHKTQTYMPQRDSNS